MSLLALLQKQFDEAIRSSIQELPEHLAGAEIAQSAQPQFGHYQCNSALKLAKALKKNPRDVAQAIIERVDRKEMIAHLEIAGPGFINIALEPAFLAEYVREMLQSERLGVPLPQRPQKIIVEFSSPNIAKELHVGHLRSTIIGDALARLFEFLGHDVLRLNHVGDWGTQFGMLIAYMKSEAPEVLSGKQSIPKETENLGIGQGGSTIFSSCTRDSVREHGPSAGRKKRGKAGAVQNQVFNFLGYMDLTQLMHWYRAAKRRFDEDPAFKRQAQSEVVALQGGDPEALRAWKIICDISRRAFREIYDLLDVRIVERGESFYNPYLADAVADLERKGLITVSGGAKCVFLEGFTGRDGKPLPMIVQKSDGGYNYATTDIAAMRHRIATEHAERIIVVTDAGQSLHFAMVCQTAVKAGYLDPQKVHFDHVAFGVVLGPDGKKFKTRSGETEKLVDLLLEAVARARVIMKERLPELNDEELDAAAHILGIDAIKYADLSCHRQKDYVFSYERMLRFEGNTAAFLLYAYVRIQGIKRKVGKEIDSASAILLTHPTEEDLALHICRFAEVLGAVARDLLPNRLAEYLYALAEKFHAFFRDCRVEGSPQEASRMLLCEATGRVLEKGLALLGLKVLQRM